MARHASPIRSAPLVLLAAALAACGARSEPPNVLLISIDTLRADRLGCNGYERDTTPSLDRFALQRAVSFRDAVAEAPWTLPSHVTMLSGLHPLTHGVRVPEDAPSPEVEFLAQRLQSTHYTFGITDGGWLSEGWGFARGFASFHARDQDIDRAVEQLLEYVRYRSDKGPWFGFLHTYDVHCPYDPPEPYAGRFRSPDAEPVATAGRCGNPHFNAMALTPGQARYLSDRYDEDVRRVDDALGVLFDALEELDLWSRTIVIVTSDHGEEFLEHGQIGHERTLEPEVLHVPLLVAVPGLPPGRVTEAVGLADVVPTLIELLALPRPARMDGRSLLALMRDGRDPGRPTTVLSDLAWQIELCAETSAEASRIVDPSRTDPGDEVMKRRAALLRGGYKPRGSDLATRRDELGGLGY